MLRAEIHGKVLEAARDNEDYLTSTVFGHLRYVPPGPFWDGLLERARGLPESGPDDPSLGKLLAATGRSPSAYSRLEVRFWRRHATHGEPDLILVFSGGSSPTLVVLIEAKLWAGKSGTGDRGQLVRYLRVLEDLAPIGIPVPSDAARFLIYLTPHESLVEVADSASHVDNVDRDLPRLFRLQWQDVLEATDATRDDIASEPTRTILADITCFLRALGLEHFRRMSPLDDLPLFDNGFGGFYRAGLTGFRGMSRETGLECFEVCQGAWA